MNNDTERPKSRYVSQSPLNAAKWLQHKPTFKLPGRDRVQITCIMSGDDLVQHGGCFLARRDSSAIEFDRVEIALILAFFPCLKPLSDEGYEQLSCSFAARGRTDVLHVIL